MRAAGRHFVDLHIHSHFSRATSRSLTPENLSLWAKLKGLSLIGTGDLTHPGWLKELESNLTRRDDGFYSLNNQPQGPRFVPTGEISAIYKQDGRTRKIHLVVIAPDLEAATALSKALGARGNVESDGRPILGLSAKQILEITLNVSPHMMMVPAHIWTPWFSLFGSQSGFDRLEDCFGDLSPHITALETGLSSDPAMNRLVSALDGYPMISSSDAHSPDKLGREATILNGPLTWDTLAAALKGGPELGGTIEFYPEEGKYHLDGHMHCGPPLTPDETKALNSQCPVCGKPLTIGVMHRVMALADRSEPPAEKLLPNHHLIPLAELLGQVFNQGVKTKKVTESYHRLLNIFGDELSLLLKASISDLEEAAGPLLGLAVNKMRRGEIEAQGGYDGQYGVISVLTASEKQQFSGQGLLFETAVKPKKKAHPEVISIPAEKQASAPSTPLLPLRLVQGDLLLDSLDPEQAAAVTAKERALAVVAGPGSGKTRVLIHRAAFLIRENLVEPEKLLLTTYTKKAAESLKPRLKAALPFRPESDLVVIKTLHALAYAFLKKEKPDWQVVSEDFQEMAAKKAARKAGLSFADFKTGLSLFKNSLNVAAGVDAFEPHENEMLTRAVDFYQKELTANKFWDFDDLIIEASDLIYEPPFKAVLVDEFQDLSAAQFHFLKKLVPPSNGDQQPSLTVIGDPDQSIYSFRGARADIFDLLKIYPDLATKELSINHRSTKNIVSAGEAVLNNGGETRTRRQAANPENGPRIVRAALPSPKSEAVYVAGRICAHLGVLTLGLGATGRDDAEVMAGLGLADIAVLFRLRAQGAEIAKILSQNGLPTQMCGEEPLTAVDGLDFTADKINLLTMHASKGLEFRLVFVIGAEEGLCPYQAPGEEFTTARQNEETRLFHVAVTRAKDRLYLTHAQKRRLYGQSLPGRPSPFSSRIPSQLCLDIKPKIKASKPKPVPTLFD